MYSMRAHVELCGYLFRYIFFLLEHPHHQWNDLKQFSDVFNWTMTYRSSSGNIDIDINVRGERSEVKVGSD